MQTTSKQRHRGTRHPGSVRRWLVSTRLALFLPYNLLRSSHLTTFSCIPAQHQPPIRFRVECITFNYSPFIARPFLQNGLSDSSGALFNSGQATYFGSELRTKQFVSKHCNMFRASRLGFREAKVSTNSYVCQEPGVLFFQLTWQ